MNSCIKTGANVFFPEYGVVVHGDLFRIGDCYMLQYRQDNFFTSNLRAVPSEEIHCDMRLGDTPFGEGYNHQSRGVAMAHKSQVSLHSAFWKSVAESTSHSALAQAKLHQEKLKQAHPMAKELRLLVDETLRRDDQWLRISTTKALLLAKELDNMKAADDQTYIQNLELVINRLEMISQNNTDIPRTLAYEALVCAHAALAAAPARPQAVPEGKYGRLTGDNVAQPVQMKGEAK